MNITAQALVFAVASVATAAAIGTVLTDNTANPGTEVVHLERVVVIGKRAQAPMEVVQLPRVVIIGHRSTQAETQVASSN